MYLRLQIGTIGSRLLGVAQNSCKGHPIGLIGLVADFQQCLDDFRLCNGRTTMPYLKYLSTDGIATRLNIPALDMDIIPIE